MIGHRIGEASPARSWQGARDEGLRQLAVFAVAYLVYFGVRAGTQGDAADAARNALKLIRFERELARQLAGWGVQGLITERYADLAPLLDDAGGPQSPSRHDRALEPGRRRCRALRSTRRGD